MLWRGRSGSSNVEDRRGMSAGGIATGGGLVGLVVYLLYSFLGGDPSQLPDMNAMQSGKEMTAEQSASEDTMAQFVSVVLAETETIWGEVFAKNGMQYQPPKLVLFRNQVQSGCGNAGAESGPFYCPADQKLYIDLSFYEELKNRFNASGDFAMAYVIAHEVGHHIQYLLGTSEKMQRLRERLGEKEYNKYSVKLELQADYYAGVWAHYADKQNHIVEPGDIEEALNAASAVGDDNIQKQTRGTIVPDAFTHGTSEQRRTWFYNGYNFGDLDHGNTFEAEL
ncbi:MAG TPA: neutral zinc metallopeptidase [Bacteroidia bacterium]|jgi:predicted metalloprotease|nr:zinc metallopeptidase [Bacteroidota bacterium]MBP9788894.1 zinc metallopeptidase [Bacteroidia bacterium]MBP9922300.1 zinc metallopeptidase [Bacteroidia bacterium]HQW22052.1 neutral zinc metallopeptidase [Bacteroidia bacterium]